MLKKQLAILSLATALTMGTEITSFAITANSITNENSGEYLFECLT